MKKFIRNGDVNLHEISKKQFDSIKGEAIPHDGSFILAIGEATGSQHRIAVAEPETLVIKKGEDDRTYFWVQKEGEITHTSDHATIPAKTGYFVQIPEREVNHFSDSITRKVTD